MKMKVLLFTCIFTLCYGSSALAYSADRWAYETRSGIPEVSHPLSNEDANVNSSWNEPRVGEVHKGVDQRAVTGTEVYPMWNTARVIDNNINATGAQTIRYFNGSTSKLFYSVYFHLSAYEESEDTVVTLTDVTAYTGDTGVPGAPHLHWELEDSIDISSGTPVYDVNYGSRIGVNPMNYVTPSSSGISSSTSMAFSVFKNPSVSGHKLTIEAWDSDVGSTGNIAYLSETKIYYKADGASTYSSTSMAQDPTNDKLWSYTFASTIDTVEYFVVGRRNSSEKWVSYPVRRILGSGTIDTSLSYDTETINF